MLFNVEYDNQDLLKSQKSVISTSFTLYMYLAKIHYSTGGNR